MTGSLPAKYKLTEYCVSCTVVKLTLAVEGEETSVTVDVNVTFFNGRNL